MKLMIMSDEESKFIWEYFNKESFKGVEFIICAGDLKLEYMEFVATMIPVPVFYVPGNHDTHFTKQSPGGCTSIDGKIITCKGLRIAGLGGCRSVNSDGKYELTEHRMIKRTKKLLRQSKNNIDILVTHAPAQGLGDGDDHFHKGFACFIDVLNNAKPTLHVFGHQHLSYGAKCENPIYYQDTLLYNACGYKIIEI